MMRTLILRLMMELRMNLKHDAEDAPAEPAIKKAMALAAPPKDTERQLSKKEMKKKELAKLDVVLAELGLSRIRAALHRMLRTKVPTRLVIQRKRKMLLPLPRARPPRRRKEG
ncbi:hypothetical protein Zm00014a_030552 [Zea mays]|nr:hypothetical protein Zm00014a_030552 [Zea mays]